jgi:hypothetical protein
MPSPGDKSASSALSSTVWFLERPNFIEGFAAIPPMEKAEDPKVLAEGEELGSNLLRVVQRGEK